MYGDEKHHSLETLFLLKLKVIRLCKDLIIMIICQVHSTLQREMGNIKQLPNISKQVEGAEMSQNTNGKATYI